jgi:hypothetical protein
VLQTEHCRERSNADVCVASELKTIVKRFCTPHPLKNDNAFGLCPTCGEPMNSELLNEYDVKYCPYCGTKFDVTKHAYAYED